MNKTSTARPATVTGPTPREPDYFEERPRELIQGGWIGLLELAIVIVVVGLLTFPCVWLIYPLADLLARAGWPGLVAAAFAGAFFATGPPPGRFEPAAPPEEIPYAPRRAEGTA